MKSTLQLNTMETTNDLRGLRRERIRERRIRKASLMMGIVLPINSKIIEFPSPDSPRIA